MFNSERIFLSGLNARKQEAIRELSRQQFRPFCSYANKYLHSMPDSEDIVQDALINFKKSKARFEELNAIYSYMRTTIHNLCIDFLNKRAKENTHLREILFLSEKKVEPHNETPAVVQFELIQRVHAEIERLPARQKDIIKMNFLEGLSVKKIAEKLGISRKTVLNIRQTGLKTLKLALGRKAPLVLLLLQLWMLISNKFRF